MSAKELELQNLEFSLGPFHQERIEFAAQLLHRKERIKHGLAEEVYRIWGENPVVIADFRHAFFDPLPYALVGDLVFARFLKRTEFIQKTVFHLVWEPHSVGLGGISHEKAGGINLDTPQGFTIANLQLCESVPNVPSWETFSEEILYRYFYFLTDKYHHWREFRENLVVRVARSDLPNKEKVAARCQENLDRLKQIYVEAMAKFVNKGSLNDFALEVNRKFLSEIFGIQQINYLPAYQSYRSSDFAGNLWQTIDLFLRNGLWDHVLNTLFADKGEQFLFVGGNSNYRMWVDYSSKKGFSLKQSRVEQKVGRPKGEKLDNEALIQYLRERTLVPTNLMESVILAFISQYLPVIRNGNDYRRRELAAKCWEGVTFHQLFADYKDGWSPVKFTRRNFAVESDPTLASMFVWNPGGNFYQEVLRKSLAAGMPISVPVEEIAERF